MGLPVPEFRNDFFMGIAQGIEERLKAERYAAYRQVLIDRGLTPDLSLERFVNFHADSGMP